MVDKLTGSVTGAQTKVQPAVTTQTEARRIIDQTMTMKESSPRADDFVRNNITPEVLKYASPAEKAHLLNCLMHGRKQIDNENKMVEVLSSIKTPAELNQVLDQAGGASKVMAKLDKQADAFIKHLKGLGADGDKMLLDMARSYPVGEHSSHDFIARYVDASVLAHASIQDKCRMLKSLMEGPTPHRDQQAMLRILQSSKNPSEILDLIRQAGGSAKVMGELGKAADGLVAQLKGLGAKGARAVADLALQQPDHSRHSQEFVQKYIDASVLKQVSPQEKVHLLKTLLHSPTGKAAEQAILGILNSAKDVNELKTLIEGAGKSWLAKEVDAPKIQKAVENKIFEVEKTEAPPWPSGDVTDKNIDAKLESLEKFLTNRVKTYSTLAAGGDKSARFKRFYSELERTAKQDLAQLKGWKSLTGWEKQEVYGRIAHEVHVELKHNVNLTYGDAQWNDNEITAIDNALSKLPPKLSLENEKLYNIRRFHTIIDPSDKSSVAGWTKGNGDIEFSDEGVVGPYRMTDRGIDPLTESILHEVGHHFDDENPKWRQFKALSGWHDVGGAKDADLRKFKDGDHVKGKQVGLADKETEFVVTRQYGRTYVYKSDAKFGVGGDTGDYAKANPYDDFAETMMQFFIAPNDLKRESLEKYKFMKEFVGR